MLRRSVVTSAALVLSGAALVGAEVWVAQRGVGPDPAATPPLGSPAGPPGAVTDTVVWLGDSTAAGVGASGIPASLPEQVAAAVGRPVIVDTLARSGDRIADVLYNQLPQVAALEPTVVYLSIGANDVTALTPRGTFRATYRQVLAGLPASVRQVVLLGIPDMGSPPRVPQPLRLLAGLRGRMLGSDVAHLAASTPGAVYVDIAGTSGPAFRRDPARYFSRDHYHPNDAGYGLWAAAVASALAGG